MRPGAVFRADRVEAGGGTASTDSCERRPAPSDPKQSSLKVREPRFSLEPLVVLAFYATRLRPSAIMTALVALTHLPSGRRLGSTRRMTCRSIKASSPCTPRLLAAAYHRARTPVAARRSRSSQKKRAELRSMTSPCTAGPRLMQMVTLERFRRGLAVVTGDHRLVWDGP